MLVSQIKNPIGNLPFTLSKVLAGHKKPPFHLALKKFLNDLKLSPESILSLEKWARVQSGISKYIRVIN